VLNGNNKRMLTILLVEDNSADAELVRDALAKTSQPGCNVVCVARLSEAVKRLSEGGIDAILLDLELPDSNGTDTFVEICRAAPETSIIVLMLSDDPSLVTNLLQLGMQDYVIKTEIRPSTLAGMLVCSIEQKRAFIELQAKYDVLDKYFSAIREGKVDVIIGSDPESTMFRVEDLKLYEENKRLAEELTRSNVELKRLDEAKSEFLSTASHELRTPLTIIKEYVALLHDGIVGPITSDQKECLGSALQNCNRLANLINDILDLQSLDSGRLRIRRKETDVVTLLNDCHRDFLPQLQMKDQQLELQVSENLPLVLCDPDKLTQVLVNLVGNAHKFTPEGGAITIRGYVPDTAAQHVTFQIEDNGIGISEEDQEHVFDKFTQLDRQPGPGAKGTGLGLAIAKNIVELHDGDISIESTVGEGTTFSFTIPVYQEALELRAILKHRIMAVTEKGRELVFSLLKVSGDQDSGHKIGDRGQAEILKQIKRIAADRLRRDDDEVVVINSEGLVAIVMEANESDGRAVMQRIIRSIAREVSEEVPLQYSMMVFKPGMEAEELIASAMSKLERVSLSIIGSHVLVVDDEELIISAMRRTLKRSNLDLKIEATTDGYDACVMFGKSEPDLVILDINMPGCSGRTVLEIIKRCSHPNNTKFLVVSGSSEEFDEMLKLGADDCLAKPHGDDELVKKVTNLLTEANKTVIKQDSIQQEESLSH